MSDGTKIEWTDATWNPVRGCTKITPGCTHCYAATFAERFRGVRGHPYEQGFDLRLVPEKLRDPFLWPSRRRVFVNSMSDLFHKDVPDEFIVRVARVMALADWHTYQVLTKRSERMAEMLRTTLRFAAELPHVWWGVSVENKKHGLPRIDHLRGAPAAVRFLSVEPLLEDLGEVNLKDIHWMIVGGESGAGARPMQPDWVRRLRDQCRTANVAFFFKQWGGVQKRKTGRKLDRRTHDDQPEEVSRTEMPARRFRLQLAEEREAVSAARIISTDIFFNIDGVRRIAGLKELSTVLVELFGSIKRAEPLFAALQKTMDVGKRERLILESYRQALREDMDVKFTIPFRVESEEKEKTSHYLIHATNHPLGFKIMKEVMWSRGHSETGQGDLQFVQASRTKYTPLIAANYVVKDDILQALATGSKPVNLFYADWVLRPDDLLCQPAYKQALLELEASGEIEVLDKDGRTPKPATSRKKHKGKPTLGEGYHVQLARKPTAN